MLQRAGASARTEVGAIEEWERVQAEAALAKEQEEAILVGTPGCPDLAKMGIRHHASMHHGSSRTLHHVSMMPI